MKGGVNKAANKNQECSQTEQYLMSRATHLPDSLHCTRVSTPNSKDAAVGASATDASPSRPAWPATLSERDIRSSRYWKYSDASCANRFSQNGAFEGRRAFGGVRRGGGLHLPSEEHKIRGKDPDPVLIFLTHFYFLACYSQKSAHLQ